jgi:hypothetical protein
VVRLLNFALTVNTVGDQKGWDTAEVFENLALQSVLDDTKYDEPALIQSAVGQAALQAAQKKKEKGEPAPRSGKGADRGQNSGGGNNFRSGWNRGGYPRMTSYYGDRDDRGSDRHYRRRSRSPPRRDSRGRY